jgi:hypothetical protein
MFTPSPTYAFLRAWRRDKASARRRGERGEALRDDAMEPPAHIEAELLSGRLSHR